MHRETIIAKLTEIPQSAGQLLSQPKPASTTSSLLTFTGRAGNTAQGCDHAGKQIERCVISTFRVAESMGFKGDLRHWQDLLRVGA
jgi:hypothetical protein